MGGKGKGGARAMFLPPARSRAPGGDDGGGPTITEKIKARKAAGGAEGWDEYKQRIHKQQQEQHALENHDVMMSLSHREVLDKEREARLRREPEKEAPKKKKRERDDSSSSSDDSDDSESDAERKRRRADKSEKRERKKSDKKEKRHKSDKSDKHRSEKKHKHKHKHKHRHRHSEADGDSKKASEPVALSAFLAQQSDSDQD